MKKFIAILMLFSLVVTAYSQSPNAFQYQSVVRDGLGNPLADQPVSFEISIIEGIPTGTVVYTETHLITTNAFGIANMAIGTGTVTAGVFSDIVWANGNHYIKVSVDITGGSSFTDMGTTQILSVPYALFAKNSGDAFSGSFTDLTNIPDLNGDVSGQIESNTVTGIQGMGVSTNIPANGQVLKWNNTSSKWEPADDELGAAGTTDGVVTGASFTGTTTKTLTLIRSNGLGDITAVFTDLVDDADASPTNEIQSLSLSGNDLTISGGNTVTLPTGTTYTAGSGISITGNSIANTAPDQTIAITGSGATTVTGTYPSFTVSSTDNNTTYTAGSGLNLAGTEFSNAAPDQTVAITGSGATTVTGTYPNFNVSSTDNNTTYTAGTGLTLTGTQFTHNAHSGDVGGTTALTVTGIQGRAITSAVPTNGQVLKFNGTSWVPSADNVDDADNSTTNEIQSLSLAGNTLSISGSNNVSLSGYVDTLWKSNGTRIYNSNTGNVGVGLNDPVGKMVVQGDATLTDSDPLFEVKDRTGATVFVVYPDSVRIFVGDDATKTNKGAFAVSGRNTSKQVTHNFFSVTPDSVRVFLDDNSAMGGFAVQSFDNSNPQDFLNISMDNSEIINPSENRIVWLPSKSAFLSGRVLIEHPDSVGTNSVAMGYESKAKGNWSQAMGYQAIARGEFSSSFGCNTVASGVSSMAIGYQSRATGFSSFAFGFSSLASGSYSMAAGISATATSEGAISLGHNSSSTGWGSFSCGHGTHANNTASAALGYYNVSNGIASTAVGFSTYAKASFSFVAGIYNEIYGDSTWGSGLSDPLFVVGNGGDEFTRHNAVTLLRNGNFGIGSSNPGNKLVIAHDDNQGGMELNRLSFATSKSQIKFSQLGVERWDIGTDMNQNNTSDFYVWDNNNGAARIYVNPVGYVGIGSINPLYKLDVDGDARLANGLYFTSGAPSIFNGSNKPVLQGGWSGGWYDFTAINTPYGWAGANDPSSIITSLQYPLIVAHGTSGTPFTTTLMSVNTAGNVVMPYVYNTIVGGANRDLYIDNTGLIGYISSSARYKKNITDMENVGWLMKLRPVNYIYKTDASQTKEYGLIAEEVEKINPLFVSYNADGTVETVNYSKFITPLIKSAQDQNKRIEELEILVNKLLLQNQELRSEIVNIKNNSVSASSK